MTASITGSAFDTLFAIAHDTSGAVRANLIGLSEHEGGWANDLWDMRYGVTLLVLDEAGCVIRLENTLQPSDQWRTQCASAARTTAAIAHNTRRASIYSRRTDSSVDAGSIVFEYECAQTNQMRKGTLAVAGLPQWANHAFATELMRLADNHAAGVFDFRHDAHRLAMASEFPDVPHTEMREWIRERLQKIAQETQAA